MELYERMANVGFELRKGRNAGSGLGCGLIQSRYYDLESGSCRNYKYATSVIFMEGLNNSELGINEWANLIEGMKASGIESPMMVDTPFFLASRVIDFPGDVFMPYDNTHRNEEDTIDMLNAATETFLDYARSHQPPLWKNMTEGMQKLQEFNKRYKN